MSMCEGHIMCNSSFSWWASWLVAASTRKVVWIERSKKLDDVYLKEWIVI